ncbi:GntR family transcriptional regulator [Nonomuraea sp. NBC_01738]|uniref:GntR family transcriptional regulator n=1 Tax=Nonomuraea sp. NBC_01738 TaxID=2976003 RepID=UPI002E150EBE|nr:GntR family transcriptional regulator [Nonomuraea sp. NBC_01738]
MEFVELTRGGGVPAHVQIERWLLGAVASGEMAPGDRLPGERDLAARLGVSRMTLRQALGTLEARGVLVRTQGRTGGAFIAEPGRKAAADSGPPPELDGVSVLSGLSRLAGFTEQVRRAHLTAEARLLEAVTVPATAQVAAALEIGEGEPAHLVARVRSAGGEPVALERSYFPAERLPGLLEHHLDGSLYELLGDTYDLRPRSALEHLDPVIAAPDDARELGVLPGTPLMRIERTAYSVRGVPLEYALDLFRPDRVRVTVRTG